MTLPSSPGNRKPPEHLKGPHNAWTLAELKSGVWLCRLTQYQKLYPNTAPPPRPMPGAAQYAQSTGCIEHHHSYACSIYRQSDILFEAPV